MESRSSNQAGRESRGWARFHQQIVMKTSENAHDSSQGMEEKMHVVSPINRKSITINQIANWNLAQKIKLKVSPRVGKDSISKLGRETPDSKIHRIPPKVWKKKCT